MQSGKHPLTKAEELVLHKMAAAGDEAAFARLIQANTWIAETLAKSYARRSGNPQLQDDLESEAIAALVDAARRFKAEFNVRLSTYATYRIKYKLQDLLADHRKQPTISLDAPISRGRDFTKDPDPDDQGDYPWALKDIVGDMNTPDSLPQSEQTLERLSRHVAALPPPYRHMVEAYFGIGRPKESVMMVSIEMGCSDQTAHKILRQAMESLKESMRVESC